MVAGIRTRDLRKVYNSAPPVAAGTGVSHSVRPSQDQTAQAADCRARRNFLTFSGRNLLPLGLMGWQVYTVGVLTRASPNRWPRVIGEHDVWQEQVAVKRPDWRW